MSKGAARRDHSEDAAALFERFAARHSLEYEISTDQPMDVLWTFPQQEKIALPITLGLQNWDELNFGVDDFWSYFFPYDSVEAKFERLLDAWLNGSARILKTGRRGRVLELLENDSWEAIYLANRFWRFRGKPREIIQNKAQS